jgi:translation initiation factor 2 gamma subunit (eIF-2gamma)
MILGTAGVVDVPGHEALDALTARLRGAAVDGAVHAPAALRDRLGLSRNT